MELDLKYCILGVGALSKWFLYFSGRLEQQVDMTIAPSFQLSST